MPLARGWRLSLADAAAPALLPYFRFAGATKTLRRVCLARGWRLSLAGAAAPALLLFLGSLALPDTPNSLLERGREEEAHRVLARVCTPPYLKDCNSACSGVAGHAQQPAGARTGRRSAPRAGAGAHPAPPQIP